MTSCRLEKRVPEKNQFRFYRLELQPTLFGEWNLVREWGRIGRQGRVVLTTFADQAAANIELARILERRHRRGYRPLSPPP